MVLPKKLEEGQAEGTSCRPCVAANVTGTDLCYTDTCTGKSYVHAITINMLPDDVFLEIFDSFRKCHNPDSSFTPVWMWYRLVQVCQRWRQLIFASPRYLDLQLLCTNGTPVRENLNCWPPFPIAVHYPEYRHLTPYDEGNIFAILNQPGRIRQIDLTLTGTQLTEVATAMQQLFPVLTHLCLRWADARPPAFPSGFLGGSAPCLQYLYLDSIVFLALTTLFSSTSDLVGLFLIDIPRDGYISPEAMVACLAVLPKLNTLNIGFQSFSIGSGRIPPFSRSRTLLPALTSFQFDGNHGYLEALVARIDCPRLNQITVTYRDQLHFQATQLFQFLDHSEDLKMSQITHADMNFSQFWFTLKMHPHPERSPALVSVVIKCRRTATGVSPIAQMFNEPSAILSRVAHLRLYRPHPADASCHPDDWLHLFRQFSAIRTLHISREFSVLVACVLEVVTGEMVSGVLPVLDFIYLDGLPDSCVEKFLAARISVHPVTVIETEAEFDERVNSYAE